MRIRNDRTRWTQLGRLGLIGLLSVIAIGGSASVEAAEKWELWQINADGTGLKNITPDDSLSYGSAQFSPDGKQIACDAWPVDETYATSKIYVMYADGTKLRAIGTGGMPSWSPDGKSVVYHTYGGYDRGNIRVVNVERGGVEALPLQGSGPVWSPDGRYVAAGSSQITVLDAATGRTKPMNNGALPIWFGGVWSSDGKQFAAAISTLAARGKPDQFAIVSLRDGVMVTHTTCSEVGVADHTRLAWSPDNQQLVYPFRTPTERNFQLYIVNVEETSKPVRLAGQPSDTSNVSPTWSNSTILFSRLFLAEEPPASAAESSEIDE